MNFFSHRGSNVFRVKKGKEKPKSPFPPPEDPFQKLPAELLTAISAMLPIQEAARTSVLSSRWRNKWRELPSIHLGENITTRYSKKGFPISCFDGLDKFLSWMGDIIRQIEERRESQSTKGQDFWIESLGLNFREELENESDDDEYRSWIELNQEFPTIVGGFKNCDMETLEKHLKKVEGFFKSLKSLVIQFGDSINAGFVTNLISGCPSLETVRLEGCSFVFPEFEDPGDHFFAVRTSNDNTCLKRVTLSRCTGVAGFTLFRGGEHRGILRLEGTMSAADLILTLDPSSCKARQDEALGPVVPRVPPRRPLPPLAVVPRVAPRRLRVAIRRIQLAPPAEAISCSMEEEEKEEEEEEEEEIASEQDQVILDYHARLDRKFNKKLSLW
ncbi:unnamed protein product [Linum tenue]|uniref:F-box domain-containing protein n=1 Tax=Linum tenue TaxID=586396 RepID=A0AAV0S4D9_9ROSI|nr:unnamed protein product [Linum tenue]